MTNVANILKAEIARISRKAVKGSIKEVIKATMILKRTVADMQRRLKELEKENKRLKAAQAKQQAANPPARDVGAKKVRLTSKGVRALRKKLCLTRPDFAKLCGTTAQTVYMWETKEGDLKLRPKTREALLSIRKIGIREAKRRLAEAQGEAK